MSLQEENQILRNELLKYISEMDLKRLFEKNLVKFNSEDSDVYQAMKTRKGYPCLALFEAPDIEFKKVFGSYVKKPATWPKFMEFLRWANNVTMMVKKDGTRHIRWSNVR
jgi:hypothetical protein